MAQLLAVGLCNLLSLGVVCFMKITEGLANRQINTLMTS